MVTQMTYRYANCMTFTHIGWLLFNVNGVQSFFICIKFIQTYVARKLKTCLLLYL